MNIELKVSGMSCNHCQAAVDKALKSIQGVTSANVNLANGTASVEGTNINPDVLIAAIVEEGYSASLAGA